MIRPNSPTAEELRREGLRALHERLGVAGAIRFLREFSRGYGDYTAERSQWLGDWSADDVEAAMRDVAADPLFTAPGAPGALHETLCKLTPWYRDATPPNQHMVRELTSFIVRRYRQEPKAVAPLTKAPEGYAIGFTPDAFATIEQRKKKPGLKLRLSGELKSLREHGAPEGLQVAEHKGFVRVYVEEVRQMGLARAWIAAAAKARGLSEIEEL